MSINNLIVISDLSIWTLENNPGLDKS